MQGLWGIFDVDLHLIQGIMVFLALRSSPYLRQPFLRVQAAAATPPTPS
jgi:hypothetical protein